MAKEKVSLSYKIAHFFTHHPWLKLVALILAITVWFYVRGEIKRFNY